LSLKIAVVEDHPDIRAGTSYILRMSSKFDSVVEYGNAESLLEAFDDSLPDIVLMDIGLPGMSGIEATAKLKKVHPRVEIVMLSVFEDDDNVFQAICAGASGYVSKPALPAQLIEAVEQASSGGTPMSPRIARKVLEMFKEQIPSPSTDYGLTDREKEVLGLLVQGLDYKLIADKLFLSVFTVRAHIRNIYDKLHVHSKSQAVAKALAERVVPRHTRL
jgi:DNA-binding NarL/FixJ family response regulator